MPLELGLQSNAFFPRSLDADLIKQRILDLEHGRVGFYSVGLYPASLAYNCAMQKATEASLMLAPRPGRSLLGAFPASAVAGMDQDHVAAMERMASHGEGANQRPNTLEDLIRECELVVLAANSNHIEDDLQEACRLRQDLGREHVVLACLA